MGSFYDEQARAWFNGTWSIEQSLLGIEAFIVDGKAYMYQGPFPALLRIPFLLLGDDFSSRLSRLSMVLAFIVAMFSSAHLHLQIRQHLQADFPLKKGEMLTVSAVAFVIATGSPLFYLASRSWVYHEALLWGVALAILSYTLQLSFYLTGARRNLISASVAAAASMLSRPSVGLGPVVSLILLLIVVCKSRSRFQLLARGVLNPLQVKGRKVSVVAIALCAFVPLFSYNLINLIKFKMLFGVPIHAQLYTHVEPVSTGNGGLFDIKFLPTTLLQYLRPDALHFGRYFPFVDFPLYRGRIFGDGTIIMFEKSSSLTSSLAVFSVLSLAGVVLVFLPQDRFRMFRIPLIGSFTGGSVIFVYSYITHRYLADAFPFLLISSLIALQYWFYLLSGGRSRKRLKLAGAVIALLAAATVWINGALALTYQRSWSSNVPQDERAKFIGFREQVDELLFKETPINVIRGTTLPESGRSGDLFIFDNCKALYFYDGLSSTPIKWTAWNAVERSREAGNFRFKAVFPRQSAVTKEMLISAEGKEHLHIVTVRYLEDKLLFEYEGHPDFRSSGTPVSYKPGREYDLVIVLDKRVSELLIYLDDMIVLSAFYVGGSDSIDTGKSLSEKRGIPHFSGKLTSLPDQIDVCKKILARFNDSPIKED